MEACAISRSLTPPRDPLAPQEEEEEEEGGGGRRREEEGGGGRRREEEGGGGRRRIIGFTKNRHLLQEYLFRNI